jgi:hypothetical protein
VSPPSAAAAPAVNPRRVAPGRPLTVPPRPRRVSGPTRRPLRERQGRSRPAQGAGIVLGLIEAVSRLSEHRLLDRLIRGRIWIGLVAFALIGIVTLQLGLLRLNAGIGHALARETSLQRENAALSIENSELAAGDLVESSAARLGMEMVPVAALRFLSARPHGADATPAAAALATPVTSTSSSSSESSSGSSGAESESSSSSTGGEGTEGAAAAGSESQASSSSGSSGSEAEAAKSGESSSPSASEPSGERTSSAGSTSGASGGAAEASGGTQAGTSGR